MKPVAGARNCSTTDITLRYSSNHTRCSICASNPAGQTQSLLVRLVAGPRAWQNRAGEPEDEKQYARFRSSSQNCPCPLEFLSRKLTPERTERRIRMRDRTAPF